MKRRTLLISMQVDEINVTIPGLDSYCFAVNMRSIRVSRTFRGAPEIR